MDKMTTPASRQLEPDYQGAAQIEAALQILQQGDVRINQADRYLTDIRASPSAWPIVCALIITPTTSAAALLFAANTLCARLRSDWLCFADDAQRLTAFTIAVDGAVRPHVCKPPSLSPIHAFGKACGFALAVASTAQLRDSMWTLLISRVSQNPVRKCHVLAAVGKQFEETATRNDTLYAVARTFSQQHVSHVITDAITMLNNCNCTLPQDDVSIFNLRAAIACINAWCAYADKQLVTHALLNVLPVPQVADDVAEALSEIVGYSGTSQSLLLQMCDALILIFQNVCNKPTQEIVQHAIAEIVCTFVEGNADQLMERDDAESKLVIARTTHLLWQCLKSENVPSFFAAVDGWTNWISADGLLKDSRRVLHVEQRTAIVNLVVSRLSTMSIVCALVPSPEDEECMDHASELARVRDLLLSACTSVGIARYVTRLAPWLKQNDGTRGHVVCTALFALSIAGDAQEGLFDDNNVHKAVIPVLRSVLDLLDTPGSRNGSMDIRNETIHTALRRLGMTCLSAFSMVLGTYFDGTDFQRVVRLAVTGVHDRDFCLECAKLLNEIAQQHSKRMLPFLPEVIASCTGAMNRMTKQAAWICTRALAYTASALRVHKDRLDALSSILATSCRELRHVCYERGLEEVEEHISRHVILISKAMQGMNDNLARSSVFAEMRDVVTELAMKFSANGVISRALCRLLETCVLPTLMEEEDSEEDRDDAGDFRKERLGVEIEQEERRVRLAMWCATLAIECFQRSSPRGEICWLLTVKDMTPHLISGLDGGIDDEVKEEILFCVSKSLQTSLSVVCVFCTGDGELDFNTQPDMATCLFKQACLIVGHATASRTMVASNVSVGMSRAGLFGLRCGNPNVARECLMFWNRVFRRETDETVWRRLLADCGGAKCITAGVLCAAQVGRLAGVAADTLFAMCAVVGAVDGVDAGDVLLSCLREAFAGDDVPRQGLDRKVKEMLFCGCVSSVRSKREFRRALDDVGRVCAMAIK